MYKCIRLWLSVFNRFEVFSKYRALTQKTFMVCDFQMSVDSRIKLTVFDAFRGLLLPKIIVDDFGGKRSDAGMLGSGIYFASSARLEYFSLLVLREIIT